MKLIKKLLASAALVAATASAYAQGPAEMFMFTQDSAYITIEKTDNGDGTFSFAASSPHPEILEYVDGTLECTINYYDYCSFDLKLKKNGPVDFTGINTSFSLYGYAEIVTDRDAEISLSLWGYNQLKISEVLTQPTTNANELGVFIDISHGDVQSEFVSSDDEAITINVQSMRTEKMLPGVTTQYQSYYLVGSAIIDTDLNVWKDGEALGDGYIVAEGNKGVSSVVEAGNVAAFLTDYWNQSGGHYSALNFFTNGTDRFQPGLDLSDYNTINFEMGCKKGVTVEAFFGRDSDSSQNFLTEIACDDFTKSYSFDISGFNRSDIQTALWFHIPAWKNTSFNDFRIWMNTFEVTVVE